MFSRLVLAGTLPALGGLPQDLQRGYVSPGLCQPCHAEIYAQYAATGMGRSFARIGSVPVVEDWNATFNHRTSGRAYNLIRRDGRFYMRRTLPGGEDAVEKQIHYVIG
jgi:hypothetical protein